MKKETTIEDLKKFIDEFKMDKPERKGFILKPTASGYDVYGVTDDELSAILGILVLKRKSDAGIINQ